MHSYWCDEEKVLEIIKEFVSTFQIYKFEFESTIKEIHTNFYNVVNSTNFKPIDTTYSKIVLKLSDKVINFCHDGTKCYFDNDKKSTVNTISNNKNNISSNEKKTNEFEEIKQQFIKNNQQNDDLLI